MDQRKCYNFACSLIYYIYNDVFIGVSGCMLVLAAYTCGKEDAALYDGSWTEWYLRAKPDQMECVPEGDV